MERHILICDKKIVFVISSIYKWNKQPQNPLLIVNQAKIIWWHFRNIMEGIKVVVGLRFHLVLSVQNAQEGHENSKMKWHQTKEVGKKGQGSSDRRQESWTGVLMSKALISRRGSSGRRKGRIHKGKRPHFMILRDSALVTWDNSLSCPDGTCHSVFCIPYSLIGASVTFRTQCNGLKNTLGCLTATRICGTTYRDCRSLSLCELRWF